MSDMGEFHECHYCSGTGDLSETPEGTEDDMDKDCPECEGTGEEWIEEEDDE